MASLREPEPRQEKEPRELTPHVGRRFLRDRREARSVSGY